MSPSPGQALGPKIIRHGAKKSRTARLQPKARLLDATLAGRSGLQARSKEDHARPLSQLARESTPQPKRAKSRVPPKSASLNQSRKQPREVGAAMLARGDLGPANLRKLEQTWLYPQAARSNKRRQDSPRNFGACQHAPSLESNTGVKIGCAWRRASTALGCASRVRVFGHILDVRHQAGRGGRFGWPSRVVALRCSSS